MVIELCLLLFQIGGCFFLRETPPALSGLNLAKARAKLQVYHRAVKIEGKPQKSNTNDLFMSVAVIANEYANGSRDGYGQNHAHYSQNLKTDHHGKDGGNR